MKKPKRYKLRNTKIPLVSDHDAPSLSHDQPLTFDDVWKMFQETDKKFQETDRQFKETDKQIKETSQQMKETDRQLKEMFKESAKRINKLDKLFTTQWGKLMESLVEGDLLPLLQARGIMVHRTHERIRDGETPCKYEFDILAENGDEAVFTEVKTTLRPEDVNYFLEKLNMVKTWMPAYQNSKVYGAVAYLTADSNSQVMAERKGLFVIRATGKSASIINEKEFKPKKF